MIKDIPVMLGIDVEQCGSKRMSKSEYVQRLVSLRNDLFQLECMCHAGKWKSNEYFDLFFSERNSMKELDQILLFLTEKKVKLIQQVSVKLNAEILRMKGMRYRITEE